MVKKLQDITNISTLLLNALQIGALVLLPFGVAIAAYISPIFNDPLVIFLAILLSILSLTWTIVGIQKIIIPTNPHTEIILQRDTKDTYKFDDHRLENIARYYSNRFSSLEGSEFWHLTIGFTRPIGITTIRTYGIDGDKPNVSTLEQNSHFVILVLENTPNNKFRITFNENKKG